MSEETNPDEEERLTEVEKVTLDSYYKMFQYSSEQFDKMILFIASGGLGISVTFIDKIICLKCASYKWLLYTSWSVFSITILIFLLAQYLSIKAARKAILDFYDDEKNKTNIANTLVKSFNIIMMVLVAIALACFFIFIIINL